MNTDFWLFSLVLLGQAASSPPPASTSPESVKVESVWDFVVKGGPVMIPIGLCSLVAVAVIIERLVSLRRRNVIPLDFFEGLSNLIGDRPIDRERALAHCQGNDSPLARILASGIKRLGEPVELLERHIQEAGEREVGLLRKYLRLLSVLGSIAPLLGLLGTITGMITAFQTVATSAEALGRTELLAKGIYEAMITTAAGLMVAIPVVLAYHGLSARIDGLVMEMDRMTVDFVERSVMAPLGAKSRPRQALAVLNDIPTDPVALESATVAVSAA
jgi:biopolymer transport protein ExbB